MAAGKSSAVIQFGGPQNIHTVIFNNDGAAGKFTVAGSADNKVWSNFGAAEFAAEERIAQLHFATATARYLRVTFESEKGGSIRAFQVFGESADDDYKLVQKGKDGGGATINLASGVGGARPIYAFPTPLNVGELGYLQNVFRFPKSRDKYRTIVYDLGSSRTVKHFAASYSRRPVRIEVFAMEQLPEKKDWRGKLTLDPEVFNTLQPVAVGEDPKGVGHIKLTPPKAVVVRYVALRFEPNYQRTSAVGLLEPGPDGLSPEAANASELAGEFRLVAGSNDEEFVVSGVDLGSNGSTQSSNGGGGQDDNILDDDTENDTNNNNSGNGSGQPTEGGGNNNTPYGFPYITGAPGSAPATLPITTNGDNNDDDNNKGKKTKGGGKGKGGGGGGGGSPPPHSP